MRNVMPQWDKKMFISHQQKIIISYWLWKQQQIQSNSKDALEKC